MLKGSHKNNLLVRREASGTSTCRCKMYEWNGCRLCVLGKLCVRVDVDVVVHDGRVLKIFAWMGKIYGLFNPRNDASPNLKVLSA